MGGLTDGDLQRYVSDLMTAFKRGEKFPYELTLAFLSVALERVFTSFADEFLNSLARVHVAEMPLSPRVAGVCLNFRNLLPTTRQKQFSVEPIEELPDIHEPLTGTPRSIQRQPTILVEA